MSNDFCFNTCLIMLYCSIEQELNLQVENYSEIQKVIDVGMKDSDEEVQKNWKRVPYEGEKPSPEELIQYLVGEMLCMEEETCEEV